MKNISRRVFIKGLAVAGVAAAASTVLAGCNTNMIPDINDGTEDDTTEETPAQNKAMVYTVGGDSTKTLTITAGEPIVLKASNMLAVPFTVANKSGKTFGTKKTGYTAASTALWLDGDSDVTVEFDGVAVAASNVADAALANNMFATSGVSVASGDPDKSAMLYVTNVPTVWNKLKVTFKLQAHDGSKEFTAKEGEFNFTNK